MYYAMIDDIESIADDAYDIAQLSRFQHDNKIKFSEEASRALNGNIELIKELMKYTYKLIVNKEIQLTEKILKGEEQMDKYLLDYRNGHMERLGQGICDPNAGIIYLELLDSMEHISDQLADITHSVMEAK